MKNCKEIQTWFEQSLDEDISPAKRMKMRFHLMICKCCNTYTKDSYQIHVTLKNLKSRATRLTKDERDRLTKEVLR